MKGEDVTHLFVGAISGLAFAVGSTLWLINYLGG